MEYIDYYKILDIEKNSSEEEIKKAYRSLAKKYHPDINIGNREADDKIKEINEAYEVLGDPDKRKTYDDLHKEKQFSTEFYDKYNNYYEDKEIKWNFSKNKTKDRSDFFNIFFGGYFFDLNEFFQGAYSRNSKFIYIQDGSDIEFPIEITLKEAFMGVDKKMTLKTPDKIKNYTIKIPKGVKDGERIRLQGQGEAGMNGGKNGDLYLVVKFKKDNMFQIEGKDIYLDVDIYPWEAALGKDVAVSLVNGKIVVKIPPGVQTDNLVRVSKKGYVDRSGNKGDLYIKIKIVNPENISPRIKKLYERLGETLVNAEMNARNDTEN